MEQAILYRILGNDLPPRHGVGQTLANTRFTLDHEPALSDCRKRWVVNRIVDRSVEEEVISLLEQQGQEYVRIPFDLEHYRSIDRADRDERIRYVVNNNGARNFALRHGTGAARWILPFDGNCFFDQTGWQQLLNGMAQSETSKYLIVPMHRLTDNDTLANSQSPPVTKETWTWFWRLRFVARTEPQIAFRFDAPDQFNETYRYGHSPKAELLWRLGVPGIWNYWLLRERRLALKNRSVEFGKCTFAGYVHRLFSGNERAEFDNVARKLSREAGLDSLFQELDTRSGRTET